MVSGQPSLYSVYVPTGNMHPDSLLAGPRGGNLQQLHIYWTGILWSWSTPTLYLADWGGKLPLGALNSPNLNHNKFKKLLK